MNKPSIQIGANVIIINSNQEILLGKRKNIFGDGTWGLPGGHLEFGEKIDKAACREVLEETGIMLQPTELTFIGISNQIQSDQHYIQTCFLVHKDYQAVNTEPERCYGWQWFNLEKLPDPIFPPHQSLIQKLTNHSLYDENLI